jgi:hypothetical protein
MLEITEDYQDIALFSLDLLVNSLACTECMTGIPALCPNPFLAVF